MTSMTVPQTHSEAGPVARRRQLRQMLTGGAVFDAAMGVFCLTAASNIGGWLSIPRAAVRETGGVFLVAAITGFVTVRRSRSDVRWVVAANLVFAAWCLLLLAADSPGTLGIVLLAGAVVSSAGTALVEHRLASRVDR